MQKVNNNLGNFSSISKVFSKYIQQMSRDFPCRRCNKMGPQSALLKSFLTSRVARTQIPLDPLERLLIFFFGCVYNQAECIAGTHALSEDERFGARSPLLSRAPSSLSRIGLAPYSSKRRPVFWLLWEYFGFGYQHQSRLQISGNLCLLFTSNVWN